MAFFSPSVVYFGMFRFDPRRLHLYRNGEQVALRPKTAGLLRFLLTTPEAIVAKSAIVDEVWGRQGVSDQTVFQTVSDLRRALQPLDPIVTHPNRGYCFALPVQRFSRVRRFAAAACVTACGMLALWVAPGPEPPLATQHDDALLSPALQAFATGVDHLRGQQPESAERYFRLAAQENPGFAEARLMIGEALLAQGRVEDARTHTDQFLAGRSDVQDYAGVSAMSLISRTEHAAGQPASALHWALAAAQQAYEQGYVCAAVDIEDQIARMIAQRASRADQAPAEHGKEPMTALATPLYALRESDTTTHCVDLGAGPDARTVPASCAPVHLASRRREAQMVILSNV